MAAFMETWMAGGYGRALGGYDEKIRVLLENIRTGDLAFNPRDRSIWGVQHHNGLSTPARINHPYGDWDDITTVLTLTFGKDLFDLGFPLPLEHSSLWLRSAAGYSWGDPGNALSNFDFGAFGNNYVDHQRERRYRDHSSLPGLEINQLEANSFGKLMLEWNLPPLRFKRAGIPDLYFTWANAALFGTVIGVNLDGVSPGRHAGLLRRDLPRQ